MDNFLFEDINQASQIASDDTFYVDGQEYEEFAAVVKFGSLLTKKYSDKSTTGFFEAQSDGDKVEDFLATDWSG